jgi:hypothetical protein
VSAMANLPKHLSRRLAIMQRLEAERQIERLAECIAYATGRGWAGHVRTLTEMRSRILADIDAGFYWPHGNVTQEVAA